MNHVAKSCHFHCGQMLYLHSYILHCTLTECVPKSCLSEAYIACYSTEHLQQKPFPHWNLTLTVKLGGRQLEDRRAKILAVVLMCMQIVQIQDSDQPTTQRV